MTAVVIASRGTRGGKHGVTSYTTVAHLSEPGGSEGLQRALVDPLPVGGFVRRGWNGIAPEGELAPEGTTTVALDAAGGAVGWKPDVPAAIEAGVRSEEPPRIAAQTRRTAWRSTPRAPARLVTRQGIGDAMLEPIWTAPVD